ncbi:hypothetical protein OIV83_006317 [Microbotryomycetes sp. JL201]|nr:hypothetical protein OIV83_006317 [Microbotryomycetes sp. JL201]
MRESNVSFPAQNRACVCISSALYDRRAIDAPAPSLPLVNSLTHLSYLTATSPRIREILAVDGGLERLIRILKACVTGGPVAVDEPLSKLKGKSPAFGKVARRSPFKAFSEYKPTVHLDQLQDVMDVDLAAAAAAAAHHDSTVSSSSSRNQQVLFTYTLAFQCVVNIGVRGSETIRTRVVEAGALDVVVTVLERYLDDMSKRRAEAEAKDHIRQTASHVPALTRPRARVLESSRSSTIAGSSASAFTTNTLVPPARTSTPDTVVSMDEGDTGSSSGHDDELVAYNSHQSSQCRACETKQAHRHGEEQVEFPERHDNSQDESGSPVGPGLSADPALQQSPQNDEAFQFKDEDVLLSLQLLAYLSKYPHVRTVFHSPSLSNLAGASEDVQAVNVFSLVEQFTHRPSTLDTYTPRHSNEVQYWAGVIMRNACRKDESRGGIRQCANMECGLWERYAREFAKCRRCRKAKYCSKTCQSAAWSKGHRYWCAKAAPKETSSTAAAAGVGEASRAFEPNTRDEMQVDESANVGLSGVSSTQRRDLRRRDSRSGTASGRTSRSSGAAGEDDDDDDDLHVPAAPLASSAFARISPAGGRRHSLGPPPNTIAGRRIGGLDTLADMNGVAVGMALGMDENQVAQDMMNGNEVVFGGEGHDVVL